MPGRLLRLLSLLQGRREWSGAELAARLGVSDRTLRRDVDRLRALDYSVDSTSGTAGGYRLVSGRNLPPLVLDDEEALAVAIGLISAGALPGIEDSTVRALAKLERVLPNRLRPLLSALARTAVAAPAHNIPFTDPATLAALASCCHDHHLVSFDYLARTGTGSPRRVEPHHLVTLEDRWYLIAYDVDRGDWRTFRVDRIARPLPAHARFTPRPLPAPDPTTYLARSLATATYRHTARLEVALAPDTLRAKLFAQVPGTIEQRGPRGCLVRLTGESAELITQYVAAIASLDTDVTLLEASEDVTDRLRRLREELPGT
ncbi:YafY family transcriptional regulator [Nocardia transvalensis]|nr:YafY family transcriptional regulator [Nocardia transvalensis]